MNLTATTNKALILWNLQYIPQFGYLAYSIALSLFVFHLRGLANFLMKQMLTVISLGLSSNLKMKKV
ncbi:hypothetical protein CWC05_24250, partial [Pseudoalteromonas ruthenica]